MVRLSIKTLFLSAVALASAKSPLLLWTNKSVADVVSTNYANADDVSNLLAPFLESCPQSVLILDQPNFDIASLKDMRAVKNAFVSAKSSSQVEHLDIDEVNNIDAIVNAIAEKCNNAVVAEEKLAEANSIVISKLSQNLSEAQRKIKNLLNKINDNTLVVFLSNNNVNTKKLLVQRQNAEQQQQNGEQQQPQQNGEQQQQNATPVKEETSVFGKYVFMNTAIMESLVVMVPFILILCTGISWLLSVRTPNKIEKKKEN
jgi:hypothetical protein